MSSKNKPVASELPTLPGIASGVSSVIEQSVQTSQTETTPLLVENQSDQEVVSSQPFMAIVEAPLASIDPSAYIQVRERLEAKEMSRKQSIALKRLHRGLEDKGEKLEDGTLITRPAQAVRWLLEQIYKASL